MSKNTYSKYGSPPKKTVEYENPHDETRTVASEIDNVAEPVNEELNKLKDQVIDEVAKLYGRKYQSLSEVFKAFEAYEKARIKIIEANRVG